MMQNPEIKITQTTLLSNNWYILNKVTYQYKLENELWENQIREVYNRGNGATILLFNTTTQNIILTRQFRLPTYLNGNSTGMMIETCAGMVENEDPVSCIIRETQEETGYNITTVTKIFEAYMSPGAVTEILYFFIGEYTHNMKITSGGGLADEQEYIEVLELNFNKAYDMIASGQINDAKTIMLLQYLKINFPAMSV